MEEATQFLFGPFRIDIADRRLWNGQQAVKLTPLAFTLLSHLVRHPGRLVTKDELLRALSRSESNDDTLYGTIKEVRKALGDSRRPPQFIETVSSEGYRFLVSVTTQGSGSETETKPAPSPQSPTPSAISDTRQIPPGFVGREKELEKLHKLLGEAFAGERRIIFLTGEPGIGKTATVEAFLTRLHVDTELWVGRGQCIDHHGAGEAYLPILDAFGQLCRSPRGQRISELLALHAPTWLVQMPTLLNASDLDALQRKTHGATRERMLREMADALEALTRETPLVLWLEDLHWSDYATLDLLSFLARRRQAARLVVVGTYRPVEVIMREHPLKTVKQDLQLQDRCVELSLGFLTEAAVREYLSVKFPANQFPPALSRILHRRTDGSPLFMVNVVEEWLTRGVLQAHEGCWGLTTALEELEKGAPQNLRQMIEQQVTRLHPHVQRMLEAASVVGDEFSAAAVAAGAGEDVVSVEEQYAALVSQDQLVQPRGTDEWPDGTITARYGFIHALYREVIYGKITPARRAQFHQRIGEQLEQGYATATSEIAPQLALHFEQAWDYPRAVRYLHQAAENAARRSAHQEEIIHLTKAVALLNRLPDDLERVRQELDLQVALGFALMAVKGYGAPEVGNTYTRARELCQQVGETPRLFSALYGIWSYYGARADYRMVYELGEQMLDFAQRQQDATSLMLGHWVMACSTFFHRADVAATRAHAEQAIALYDAEQLSSLAFQYGYDPGVSSRSFAALSLWALGYPEQALRRSQEALALARACSHHFSEAWALLYATWLHFYRRDHRAVQEHAEATITLSHTQGFPFWIPMATIFRGRALAGQGQYEEGIAQVRQGLAVWREMEAKTDLPYFLAILAEAYGEKSDSQEGLTLITDALKEIESLGERFYEAEVYRIKGELTLQQENQKAKACPELSRRSKSQKAKITDPRLLTPDPQGEAEACFLKAIEIARHQHAKMWELRATVSLCRLWQQQGKNNKAQRTLAEVYNWFTEGFDTVDLQEAKGLLSQLSQFPKRQES